MCSEVKLNKHVGEKSKNNSHPLNVVDCGSYFYLKYLSMASLKMLKTTNEINYVKELECKRL